MPPMPPIPRMPLLPLPANMAHVLLPLAANDDNELRWRAIQGLMPGKYAVRVSAVKEAAAEVEAPGDGGDG